MGNGNKFKSGVMNLFGLEEEEIQNFDDPEDEEDDILYEDEKSYVSPERLQNYQTTQRSTKSVEPKSTVSNVQPAYSGNSIPDVLVLEPLAFEEAPGIVNKLKQDKTIVLNLKETDYEAGKKIFDFLTGAVYALEGSLNKIADSVFILAPKLVNVSTQKSEPKDEPTYSDSYSSESISSWVTE